MTEKEVLKYLSSRGIKLEADENEHEYIFETSVILLNGKLFPYVEMEVRCFTTSCVGSIHIENVTEAHLDKFIGDVAKWRSLEEDRRRRDRIDRVRNYFDNRRIR